jgi:mRNA interferase MazF
MNRGDVHWVLFPEPTGHRPALILTRQAGLRILTAVTVAPITTTLRDIPTRVVLDVADGLPTLCCVNLDAIQTIARDLIGDHIASLSSERLLQVRNATVFALGLDA